MGMGHRSSGRDSGREHLLKVNRTDVIDDKGKSDKSADRGR